MSFTFGSPAAATPTTPAFGTTFGGTTTTPAFGSTAPASTFGAPAATTTFGAPATTTTPAFGGTTFGTPATTFGAPTTATPAFGAAPAATFGAPTTTTTFGAPATTTFGTPATTTTFGAPATTFGASTFGAPTTTTTPAFGTTTTGSTFGSATPSFGGFGSTTAATTATPSFGGFGSTTSTPSFGGFGSTTAATAATPAFGGFGSTTTSLPTTLPGPNSNITGTTKFGDLPDNIKKGIEQMRKMMNDQKAISDEIANRSAAVKLPQIKADVVALIERTVSLCGIVESDKEAVAKFRIDVVRTVKNTEDAYYSLQRLKAGGYIPPSLQFPPPYFWDATQILENRLQQCKNTLNEIERYLQTSADRKSFDPLKLQDLMRHQHEVFIGVAAQVALVHETMEKQRELYLQYLKKQSLDTPNPFEEARKKPVKTPNPRVSQGGLATPSTPQVTTPSLFSTPTATPTTTAPSLFGTATPSATPLTGTSLFSTTPSTPSAGTFGSTATPTSSFGSTFGSTASTPSGSTAFGTGLSLSNIAPTTATPSLFGTPTPGTPVSTASLTPSFGSFASTSSPSMSKKPLSTSTTSTQQGGRRKARNSK